MTSRAPTTPARGRVRAKAVPERPSGRTILARVWGIALVTTVPAGVLHGVAHGHTPPLIAYAVAFAIAAAISAPIVASGAGTDRSRRRRTAAAIIASQAFFHVFFAIATTPLGAALGGGHAHHGDPAAARAALTSFAPSEAASFDGTMFAAHALAAVVTIAAVRYGEALLTGIVTAGRRGVSRLAGLRTALAGMQLPAAPKLPVVARVVRPLQAHCAGLLQGRAPPAFA